MIKTPKELDQFFTQDKVANECVKDALEVLKELKYDIKKVHFIEPSAGDGAFIRALKNNKINEYSAYDIDVKRDYIKKNDFLKDDLVIEDKKNTVIIGNPPFGKRAKVAIEFLNKSFEYSDTVIFILPLQFNKYSAQKQIEPFANLVFNKLLDEKSFIFEKKPYSVRCCLQVWTLKKNLPDIRLKNPPQIKHEDFEMWQYNNTKQAEKYFNKEEYKWDFAVPRQGYKDYTLRENNPDNMSRRTQWIFFKAKNKNILHNLLELDYVKLSLKNTSTPGFGKADVVEEYNLIYNNDSQ